MLTWDDSPSNAASTKVYKSMPPLRFATPIDGWFGKPVEPSIDVDSPYKLFARAHVVCQDTAQLISLHTAPCRVPCHLQSWALIFSIVSTLSITIKYWKPPQCICHLLCMLDHPLLPSPGYKSHWHQHLSFRNPCRGGNQLPKQHVIGSN